MSLWKRDNPSPSQAWYDGMYLWSQLQASQGYTEWSCLKKKRRRRPQETKSILSDSLPTTWGHGKDKAGRTSSVGILQHSDLRNPTTRTVSEKYISVDKPCHAVLFYMSLSRPRPWCSLQNLGEWLAKCGRLAQLQKTECLSRIWGFYKHGSWDIVPCPPGSPGKAIFRVTLQKDEN